VRANEGFDDTGLVGVGLAVVGIGVGLQVGRELGLHDG
jgi:hypothetical protein